MNKLEIILLIISFIIFILLNIEIYLRKQGLNLSNKIKISPQNNILFYKLQKQYLNNSSDKDIEELCVFLYRYLKERKIKK